MLYTKYMSPTQVTKSLYNPTEHYLFILKMNTFAARFLNSEAKAIPQNENI